MTLADAEGTALNIGADVAFYFADAEVKRGTVVSLSQSVWEHRHGLFTGDAYIVLKPGGKKYKRRASTVIVLSPQDAGRRVDATGDR